MRSREIRRCFGMAIDLVACVGMAVAFDWRACAVASIYGVWMYWHATADCMDTFKEVYGE